MSTLLLLIYLNFTKKFKGMRDIIFKAIDYKHHN